MKALTVGLPQIRKANSGPIPHTTCQITVHSTTGYSHTPEKDDGLPSHLNNLGRFISPADQRDEFP